jgi:hypothetical protein
MAKAKKASKPVKKTDATTDKRKKYTPNYCSLVEVPQREFTPEVGANRARMILVTQKKWVNGTKLKYYFFNGSGDGSPASWKGSSTQITTVKQAFSTWKHQGIGLEFEETNDRNEAQVRIGFMRGDGA